MRARLHHLVIDAPDPLRLASFYSALLGDPVTYVSEDFVVVSAGTEASGLAFQRAPDHRASTWPDSSVPQQMHLDVMVDDVAASRSEALELGATALGGDVFADPAGHPFCLIKKPSWAPPLDRTGTIPPPARKPS